ncbi:DUF3631 domain-containing protein [Acidobacteria bacterium AH-259-D05]|nr:DUF3631 domain-containing protein [Acidobacteria bacterium AH-259-D05]
MLKDLLQLSAKIPIDGTVDEKLAIFKADSLEFTKPWARSVDGAKLMGAIQALLERYFVLDPMAVRFTSAWVVGTWFFQFFHLYPYYALRSPTKGCGKTNLLLTIGYLTPRPQKADDLTPAVLFRCVEQDYPTLLLDEFDQKTVQKNKDLRPILNAGYRSDGQVLRNVPTSDGWQVKRFPVYCPKALAGIGNYLPPTVHDRSVHIHIDKKKKEELVTRWRMGKVQKECADLKRKLKRWALDNRGALAEAPDPKIPSELTDRQLDNWEPILKIAHLIGGRWPAKLRKAAIVLSNEMDEPDPTVEILTFVKGCFDQHERWHSQELVTKLTLEGHMITPRRLADILRPFKIKPRQLWVDGKNRKGYEQQDFKDAFERYLQP